mmetsp:Transcript_85810/g.246281  ORF Transcript_85810/g.246281 Transcript_85810/m.246281 type:complete len:209 (-) Transcript_85810:872-1498(-)
MGCPASGVGCSRRPGSCTRPRCHPGDTRCNRRRPPLAQPESSARSHFAPPSRLRRCAPPWSQARRARPHTRWQDRMPTAQGRRRRDPHSTQPCRPLQRARKRCRHALPLRWLQRRPRRRRRQPAPPMRRHGRSTLARRSCRRGGNSRSAGRPSGGKRRASCGSRCRRSSPRCTTLVAGRRARNSASTRCEDPRQAAPGDRFRLCRSPS